MKDRISLEEYKKIVGNEIAEQDNKRAYGKRGMDFEGLLSIVNEQYLLNRVAVIEKVPTDICVTRLNRETGRIEGGYFRKKTRVDYMGTFKGASIVFEAKSTKKNHFPFGNMRDEQVEFLIKHNKVGAVCFFLVHFQVGNNVYYLSLEDFLPYWEKKKERAHIPIHVFQEKGKLLKRTNRAELDYLLVVEEEFKSSIRKELGHEGV